MFFAACNNDQQSENNTNSSDMKTQFEDFIKKYEETIKPLESKTAIAYWDASITGKDEDYDNAASLELELNTVYTNKEDFEFLKKVKESGEITDELLKRELDLIYNSYLSKQIDVKTLEETINLETKIQKDFSTFRADVDGKELTNNDIEEILSKSTDNNELKATWLACKKIGPVVVDDIKKVVALRNQSAKSLGFKNFHEMKLKLNDQDPKEIENLFNELDDLTRETFTNLKSDIDDFLSKRYKISKDELMPWHYQNQFFQEAPAIYDVDLDKYYKDQDLVDLTNKYFAGIGMEIQDIIDRSDLFEKPGKDQHAYCTDIDKAGDIRILCNVKPNYKWMNTMLHEFGHGVYDKYIDENLPYTLREPANTFTTEAIAMIFGRFASNAKWLQDMLGIDDTEKEKIADLSFKSLKLEQLVFSRWAQVMYRFEKGMYENPDQDLNKLWWNLVEKYQMIKAPEGRNEPDWATKTHIANYPCYYHNYLLGELFASQMFYDITKNVLKSDDFKNQSFVGNKEVGNYFIEKIFKPAKKWYWNDMIENATGEKLTAKYYAMQFVD